MKIWCVAIVFVGLIGAVLSWDKTGISNCAKGCVEDGLKSECSGFDGHDKCICGSSQLYSFVACCAVMRCPMDDWKAADRLVNNTCTDANVKLITDLEACKRPTGTVNIPTYPYQTDPSEASSKQEESRRIKIVIATVVPIASLALILVFCIFYIRRRRSKALRVKEMSISEPRLEPTRDEGVMFPRPYSVDDGYPALLDSQQSIQRATPVQLQSIPVRHSLASSITIK